MVVHIDKTVIAKCARLLLETSSDGKSFKSPKVRIRGTKVEKLYNFNCIWLSQIHTDNHQMQYFSHQINLQPNEQVKGGGLVYKCPLSVQSTKRTSIYILYVQSKNRQCYTQLNPE
jgi:hypothetical protein